MTNGESFSKVIWHAILATQSLTHWLNMLADPSSKPGSDRLVLLVDKVRIFEGFLGVLPFPIIIPWTFPFSNPLSFISYHSYFSFHLQLKKASCMSSSVETMNLAGNRHASHHPYNLELLVLYRYCKTLGQGRELVVALDSAHIGTHQAIWIDDCSSGWISVGC